MHTIMFMAPLQSAHVAIVKGCYQKFVYVLLGSFSGAGRYLCLHGGHKHLTELICMAKSNSYSKDIKSKSPCMASYLLCLWALMDFTHYLKHITTE